MCAWRWGCLSDSGWRDNKQLPVKRFLVVRFSMPGLLAAGTFLAAVRHQSLHLSGWRRRLWPSGWLPPSEDIIKIGPFATVALLLILGDHSASCSLLPSSIPHPYRKSGSILALNIFLSGNHAQSCRCIPYMYVMRSHELTFLSLDLASTSGQYSTLPYWSSETLVDLCLYPYPLYSLALPLPLSNVSGQQIAAIRRLHLQGVYPGEMQSLYQSLGSDLVPVFNVTLAGLPILFVLKDERLLKVTWFPDSFNFEWHAFTIHGAQIKNEYRPLLQEVLMCAGLRYGRERPWHADLTPWWLILNLMTPSNQIRLMQHQRVPAESSLFVYPSSSLFSHSKGILEAQVCPYLMNCRISWDRSLAAQKWVEEDCGLLFSFEMESPSNQVELKVLSVQSQYFKALVC